MVVNCGPGVADGVVAEKLLGDGEESEVEAGPAQGIASTECLCSTQRRTRMRGGLRRGLAMTFELPEKRSKDRHEVSAG